MARRIGGGLTRASGARGAGGGALPFDPLTAPGMFSLYREGGTAASWTDPIGGRHAVQGTADNQPSITASDSDFNGQTSRTFTGDDFMNCGGTVAAWKVGHDTSDFTGYAVHRPSSTTGDTKYLINAIGDLVAGSVGYAIMAHNTQQTQEPFYGNNTAVRLATMWGADGEMLREQVHITVWRKNASGFELWLDGALLVSGEWNGVPSSSNAGVTPSIGGYSVYSTTRQYEGKIAEVGFLTRYADPAAITAYCRARYNISTVRSPTHRMLHKDGVNVGAGIDTAGARVWSYFTQASTTPGASQDAMVVISRGTVISSITRSNGAPWPEIDGGANDRRTVQIAHPLNSTPAWASTGLPVRVNFILGESGASGRGSVGGTGTIPAGYPPVSGAPYQMDNEFQIATIAEFVDRVQPQALDVLNAESGTVGYGWAGFLTWMLQQADSGHTWVALSCGKGGSTSTQWASATSRNTNFGAAAARLLSFLELARAHGVTIDWDNSIITLDQGLNDALSSPTSWDTNWAAILSAIRGLATEFASLRCYYRKHPLAAPTDGAYPGHSDLLGDQDALATAGPPANVKVPWDVPSGFNEAGGVHLNIPANVTFAGLMFTPIAADLGL